MRVQTVVIGIPLAAIVAFLLARPRILLRVALAPFVVVVAAWQVFRTLLHLPSNLTKWLAYSVSEKEASALRHHAETASALWAAGPEYRPAAHDVLNRVLAGYGIRPADREANLDLPAEDPFHAAARRAAAEAVTNSRGGLVKVASVLDAADKAATSE